MYKCMVLIMYERTGHLINKKFMQYLLPTVFMSMALSLGVIVDGIIAANLISTDALAAINLCTPIILCFSAIYSIFGVGGSTLAAIALGKRDKDRASVSFTVSILSLVGFGILVTVVGSFFMDEMVGFVAQGGELTELVKKYLEIYIYGALIFFIVPGIAYFIRADGKPGLSAAILVTANIVNLSCDIIYIKFFDLGIAGAAYASLTGYFVGVFITIPYFMSKAKSLKFKKLKAADFKVAGDIVTTGLPSALNSLLMFIKISVINSVALKLLGSNGAAVVAICNNCLSFAAIFIGGAAQTMLPIMAVLFGEEDYAGMKLAVKKAIKVVMLSGIVILAVFELIPTQVALVFGVQTEELMRISVIAIRLFGLSLPLFGIDYILMSYFQATSRKTLALFATIVQGIVFIVPFVLLFSNILPDDGFGIWFAFCIAEVCTFLTIWTAAHVVGKKEKLDGMFLLKDVSDAKEIDITIECLPEKAAGISERVIAFCSENGIDNKTANAAGMAIEEMSINTIEYGYKNSLNNHIDIKVKLADEHIIIRLRDSGAMFNPAEFLPQENEENVKLHGIEIVKELAENVEYSRTLGFNNLIIKI